MVKVTNLNDNTVLEFLSNPWPWYFGGPIIGILYLVLHIFGRRFGISSTLRTTCSMLGAGKVASLFDYDWKEDSWNLFFIVGSGIGAFLAVNFLTIDVGVKISESTHEALALLNIDSYKGSLAPTELFSFTEVSIRKVLFWIIGGFFSRFWNPICWRLYFRTRH